MWFECRRVKIVGIAGGTTMVLTPNYRRVRTLSIISILHHLGIGYSVINLFRTGISNSRNVLLAYSGAISRDLLSCSLITFPNKLGNTRGLHSSDGLRGLVIGERGSNG